MPPPASRTMWTNRALALLLLLPYLLYLLGVSDGHRVRRRNRMDHRNDYRTDYRNEHLINYWNSSISRNQTNRPNPRYDCPGHVFFCANLKQQLLAMVCMRYVWFFGCRENYEKGSPLRRCELLDERTTHVIESSYYCSQLNVSP